MALSCFMITFTGHHGTDYSSAQCILSANFELSEGDADWLGDGVYFFVKGLNNDTQALATNWARCHSWNNQSRSYKHEKYGIIESKIQVKDEEFLDLTIEEGVQILNYLVEKYISKLDSIGKGLKFYDGLILNLARKEGIFPLEVIKGNFYIKFEKERIHRINLRTNNCTICSVYNPSKVISNNSMIKTGVII